ncbi:hypothetical protein BDN70DRAFT_901218 [Pholiota conissans]|uniref:Uncharacterized protein n=1 Tax=Pholiota conissans TaxID=109636 RepID=A0A9P5YKP7_9AGAR|nr:hypothetical protein BDN70DRAFT_901218 [Pholiota conissans]
MITNVQYPGLHDVFDASDPPLPEEIQDDIEGEQETVPDLTPEDLPDSLSAQPLPINNESPQWEKTAAAVSKGIKDETDAVYRQVVNNYVQYLLDIHVIERREDFLSKLPREDAPSMIIVCIMKECDPIQLDGSVKPPSAKLQRYAHAQKIRAAMTHVFARIFNLGRVIWHRDENSGCMRGNPSCSDMVASYMLGLRRRKARLGEVMTSARAITSLTFLKIYEFNHCKENWTLQDYVPGVRSKKAEDVHKWGGPMARRQLEAIFTIGFLCLLRSDEVLKIRMEHITFHENDSLTLMLPFRKTNQDGGAPYLAFFKESTANL